MIAQALFCTFGGGGDFADYYVAALCNPDELHHASLWGLAMRLGQRLSGGVATSLEESRLSLKNGVLRLDLAANQADLYGEVVERRLRMLAAGLACKAEVSVARPRANFARNKRAARA